jgi:hypothetical protein
VHNHQGAIQIVAVSVGERAKEVYGERAKEVYGEIQKRVIG